VKARLGDGVQGPAYRTAGTSGGSGSFHRLRPLAPDSALHRLPGGSPYTPAADILQVPERWKGLSVVTRRFVREAHRLNIPVQVWTVDDEADMRRLLDLGVDGVQTDRPDVLARVLSERGSRPPPPGTTEIAA